MHQLNIVSRIIECEENGWHDLLSKVDGITQSLIDNPSAAQPVITALRFWCDAVDCRVNGLPPDEQDVMLHNPIMNIRATFGTEV